MRTLKTRLKLMRDVGKLHDSFAIFAKHIMGPVLAFEDVPERYLQRRELMLNMDGDCPNRTRHPNATLVCPSYCVMEHDPFRIPEIMVQAKCQCVRCLLIDQEENKTKECRQTFYYSRVLRVTGCKDGRYEYKEVLEPVSVGCSCVER